MKQFQKKLFIGLLILIGFIFVLYYVGLSHYFSLEGIKANASYLKTQVEKHYFGSVIGFMLGSTTLIAFTLPVTGPVAVLGGFLFGLWPAVLYTMISALVGTAISFLVVSHAMSHVTRHHYGAQLASFKEQLNSYGHTYLITLQLLTVVPYFVINTLAVLAGVPFSTFMWTTAIGSLPIVIIYAFAGRQLYMIQSWGDILSVNMLLLLLMLALLALLPMIIYKFRGVKKR